MAVKNTIFQMNSKALLTTLLISLGSYNVQAAVDCNNKKARASYLEAVNKFDKILYTATTEKFVALAYKTLPSQHAENINKNLNLKKSLTANFTQGFLAAKNSLLKAKVCEVGGRNFGHPQVELVNSTLPFRLAVVFKEEIDKKLKVLGIVGTKDTRPNNIEVFSRDFEKVFQNALIEAIRKNPNLFGPGTGGRGRCGPGGFINGTEISGITGSNSGPQPRDGSRFAPGKTGLYSDDDADDGNLVCDETDRGEPTIEPTIDDPCASVGDGYATGSYNGQRVWSACSGGKSAGRGGFGPPPRNQMPTDEGGASGPAPEGFLGGGVKVTPTNGLGGDGEGDQNSAGPKTPFSPGKPGSGGCQVINDRSTVGINSNLKPGKDLVGCTPGGVLEKGAN